MAQTTLRPLKIKVEEIMAVKPRLLDQVRDKIRFKHYSIRTEHAYVDWIKRYILFHGKRHPQEMGKQEAEQFLSHLAVDRNVAASTQNQALSAILFLYKEVLEQDIGWLENVERAKRPARLPVVLTATEVRAVLAHLEGRYRLMANLLYGAGLRLADGMRPLAGERLRFRIPANHRAGWQGPKRSPDDATGRPDRTAPDPLARFA